MEVSFLKARCEISKSMEQQKKIKDFFKMPLDFFSDVRYILK